MTPDDLVVIAPNDPGAMNRYATECIAAGIPYLYDPSMQLPRLERADLEKGCRGARILAGNDYEFGMMAEKLGVSEVEPAPDGAGHGDDAGRSRCPDHRRQGEFDIPPARPKEVLDPTGAGDAFRAGFMLGMKQGLALAGGRPAGRPVGRLRHRAQGAPTARLHARRIRGSLPGEFRVVPRSRPRR